MSWSSFNKHIDDRDRLMNKWRLADSPELRGLVNNVIANLENYERLNGIRKRARKANDLAVFKGCVEALVCDLVHRAMTSEDGKGRIAVSMDTSIKRSRYKGPTDSRQFPHIVALMEKPEMGYLELCDHGDWQIGKRTAVRAGVRLLDQIDQWGIELYDLALNGDEEIVIQKRAKHDPMNTVDGRAEWIDYKDSPLSRKYRKEVREINEWLHAAEIDYSGDRLVDLTDKRLRRYFNNASFKQGGRLFGGFWQQLRAKQVALCGINGHAVSEVDYKTMQVALLRAEAGIEHDTFRDAYHIPGFEKNRKGIKKIMASMLFAKKPMRQWPTQTSCLFPPGTHLEEVIEAIRGAHPELEPYWFTGIGYELMFTESQILVNVLLKLKAEGIVALPKHDCVVVASGHALTAARVMRECFEAATGGTVGVTRDGDALPVCL